MSGDWTVGMERKRTLTLELPARVWAQIDRLAPATGCTTESFLRHMIIDASDELERHLAESRAAREREHAI